MVKKENELKILAQRMMTEKWHYKSQSKGYVCQVMKALDQTELMALLDELNYKELKMISGCGIPGDAWMYSVALLKKKREEIDLFIDQGGTKASASVEHDEEEAPVS